MGGGMFWEECLTSESAELETEAAGGWWRWMLCLRAWVRPMKQEIEKAQHFLQWVNGEDVAPPAGRKTRGPLINKSKTLTLEINKNNIILLQKRNPEFLLISTRQSLVFVNEGNFPDKKENTEALFKSYIASRLFLYLSKSLEATKKQQQKPRKYMKNFIIYTCNKMM